MLNEPKQWRPGSFTKNFSWGGLDSGLARLHEAIRQGFDGQLEDVPRDMCIARMKAKGFIWHIPANFFLLNIIKGNQSYFVVDELVYQALAFEYSSHFDHLALTTFNNSYVGTWIGAEPWQKYPAPWAYRYITDQIATNDQWNTSAISATEIEKFIKNDDRYLALSAKKISTNLNYMYRVGRIKEMASLDITRGWVNSLFLILDRAIAERGEQDQDVPINRLLQYVAQSSFLQIAGARNKNKELAVQPIVSLYSACGGLKRWSPEAVRERQNLRLPEIGWFANSDNPFFAIYPEDPNIIKSVPRACAMLARNLAGFEEIDAEDLINWNVLEYIRRKTRAALQGLKDRDIKPTMTADELLKITRGK